MSLLPLQYLNLDRTQVSGPLPESWGKLPLNYLNLDRTQVSGPLPESWGKLPLNYLNLYDTDVSGPIPCGLNATSIFNGNKLSWEHSGYFSFASSQCLPLCYLLPQYSQYSPYGDDDMFLRRDIKGLKICPNSGCMVTQYADLAKLKCENCPKGYLTLKRFSYSSNDCINPAMNFVSAIIALLLSIAAIVVYVYFGRIHRVSFIRMERVVHVLIKKYKITIAALKSFQEYLKREPKTAASSSKSVSQHRRNVFMFWTCTSAILLFLPIALFLLAVWRRLLDVLILWNGFKETTENFERTVNETINAVAKHLSMPFVKDLFKPLQQMLDLLSKINFIDIGPVKITCSGAQAPYYLFIQVLVFGVTIIVISSDYQVFKMNLFGSLLDTFKGVTASRSYRKFVLTQDERFHWSPYRYLSFLVYAALAELFSFLSDFSTILKFCISLISYNGIKYRLSIFNSFHVLLLYGFPFGSYALWRLIRDIEYADMYSSRFTNACNLAEGWIYADAILSTMSFNVSAYVLIIFFYEIGKAVAPGNRIPNLADFKPAPRIEPHSVQFASEFATKARRLFMAAYEKSLWALSFVSGDLYIAVLAEKWLEVVHKAVPPSVLNAAQPIQSQAAIASPVINKRASLGWSAVMQPAEPQSLSSSPSDEIRVCCSLGDTNVFMRTFTGSQTPNATTADASSQGLAAVSETPPKEDWVVELDKDGYGICVLADKTCEGRIIDGKLTGFGRCSFTNGNLYIGEWKDDQLHGVGLLKYGNVVHIGSFKQGPRHGRILQICQVVNATCFAAAKLVWEAVEYEDGDIVHSPTTSKADAFEYIGERNDGHQKHGKGSMLNKNGEFYSGEYLKDMRHGCGVALTYNKDGAKGYSGQWQHGLKHGEGIEFSSNRTMVRGEWQLGIKVVARRFALEPAHTEEEEQQRWQEYKSEHSLPTYSEFISFQYQRILAKFPFWPKSFLPVRLLFKLVAAGFVWYGLGNFLRGSLSIWYQILRNYFIFIVSAVGIWTTEARLLYAVDECIETTNITEDSEKQELEVSDKWKLYARAWSSILAPRYILFMVVPYLTPMMLYSTIMAPTPIYIMDSQVPLPPWFDLESYYRRSCRDESVEEDQEWIAVVDAVYLFATESRIVQTIINAFKFAISIAIWQAGYSNQFLAIEGWSVAALVILFPYCCMLSLKPIVYLGKALNIKNNDVLFWRPKDSVSSSRRDTDAEADPVDIVPRPSITIAFDSVYAVNELPQGNHSTIEMSKLMLSSQSVRSPLTSEQTTVNSGPGRL